jgi:2-polyprenyl-3-methyl-5-hydroxy-6-metoxy-1,4-benzoquinol methylase
MHTEALHIFPTFDLFHSVCRQGLSVVRPLDANVARARDQYGWNYGTAKAPSYWTYGRLRVLLTLQLAETLRPKRILEIAAGDASLSASLAQRLGCKAVANELREEHMKQNLKAFSNGDAIETAPGNLFELTPERIGVFDLVLACEIIEHVAHTQKFLEHMRRFIAPNGRLLITTPNGSYFRNKLPTHSDINDFNALEAGQFKPDADGHQFLITPSELSVLASAAGLQIERSIIWGTPFITGESGFGVLCHVPLPYYRLERLCQGLRPSAKERLCNNMMVVLKHA